MIIRQYTADVILNVGSVYIKKVLNGFYQDYSSSSYGVLCNFYRFLLNLT